MVIGISSCPISQQKKETNVDEEWNKERHNLEREKKEHTKIEKTHKLE